MQQNKFDHLVYPAKFSDGETAKVHDVRVRLTPIGIRIELSETGEKVSVWPKEGLVYDYIVTGEVRITTPTVAMAELRVQSLDFVRDSKVYQGRSTFDFKGASGLFGLLAIVVVLMIGVWFAIDPFSGFVADRVPISWEEKYAEQLEDYLKDDLCHSKQAEEVLHQLIAKLNPQTNFNYKIFIQDESMVNAFAGPGGIVIFTRGFLKKAVSGDEIAGVLAHELAHVEKRHMTKSVVRGSILSALWAALFGDYSGLLVVDPSTLGQLVSLRFSRDAEAEADQQAIQMLDRARISRQGFAEFFSRLTKDGVDIPDIVSTHPASQDRREKILDGAPKIDRLTAMNRFQFELLQSACDK